MLTAAEIARLRQYRLRANLGCAAIALLVFGVALLVAKTFTQQGFLDRGQWLLLGPLVVFWLYLLRHFPGQWLQIKRDLQTQRVHSLGGLATVYMKPGVLFSPPRTMLAVQGSVFSADGLQSADVYPGTKIKVRYGAASGCLLSVQPLTAENQADHASLLLNDREQTLLKLIGQGLADKHIARQLNLSPSTVRTYNSALYRKLAVNDRKQAIQKARELGLDDVN